MALRGLVLLAALALGGAADNFKWTDCKGMPSGVTAKTPQATSPYQLTAAAPDHGMIEVTIPTGKLKFFRITAMEDGKETMPKGEFMLDAGVKAMLMKCDTMDKPDSGGKTDGGNGGKKDAGGDGKNAQTKGAASCTGLSAWLVIVSLGLVVLLGLGNSLSIN
ncbi:hypothetical protein HPB52_006897 [Rhipicephalus sanguineus]|uniref:Uncharacterized protein n=1 Tax=Rhipicephalus sanguineus TaxID=34632 RepID=A0A9D4PD21_RHISA|nr:hypothetical protein HPB52_006897 [Rhipicephalus sanguineus]